MIKRILILSSLAFSLLAMSVQAQPQPQQRSNSAQANNAARENADFRRKVEIMEEDENESTDIFAIPLDDSDVEDEQEVDYLMGKPFDPAPPPPRNNDAQSQQRYNGQGNQSQSRTR